MKRIRLVGIIGFLVLTCTASYIYHYLQNSYRDQLAQIPEIFEHANFNARVKLSEYDCDSLIRVLKHELSFNDSVKLVQDYSWGFSRAKIIISQKGQLTTAPVKIDTIGRLILVFRQEKDSDIKYTRTRRVIDELARQTSECDEPYPKNDSIQFDKFFKEEMAKAGMSLTYTTKFICARSWKDLPAWAVGWRQVYPTGRLATGDQIAYRTPFGLKEGFDDEYANLQRFAIVISNEDNSTLALKSMAGAIVGATIVILISLLIYILLLRSAVIDEQLRVSKDVFNVNLSEQLKTPVTSLTAAISQVEKQYSLGKRSKAEHYLGLAGNELKKLIALVEHILHKAAQQQVKLVGLPPVKRHWFPGKWTFNMLTAALFFLAVVELKWVGESYYKEKEKTTVGLKTAAFNSVLQLHKIKDMRLKWSLKRDLNFPKTLPNEITVQGFAILIHEGFITKSQNVIWNEDDIGDGAKLIYARKGPISRANYLKAHRIVNRMADSIKALDKASCGLPVPSADSALLVRLVQQNFQKLGINERFSIEIECWNLKGHNYNGRDTTIGSKRVLIIPYRPTIFQTASRPLNVCIVFEHGPRYMLMKRMGGRMFFNLFFTLIAILMLRYLSRLVRDQQQLTEMQDSFINNMTHELKTPLATVSAAVEAMQHFGALDDEKKARRYISTAIHETERIKLLSDKLLFLKIALDREDVNVAELLREVARYFDIQAKKKMSIVIKDEAAVKIISADRMHLRNMISNLLDNAVKYSGEEVTIMISTSSDKNSYVIAVKDNGKGIHPMYRSAIFDQFYRIPTGNIHAVKGYGLGLSYVKYVAKLHNGSVGVNSEPGKGSEFIVSLPLIHGT